MPKYFCLKNKMGQIFMYIYLNNSIEYTVYYIYLIYPKILDIKFFRWQIFQNNDNTRSNHVYEQQQHA